MASLSDVKSRRWWWDSHISPKNSKWLQENLTVSSSPSSKDAFGLSRTFLSDPTLLQSSVLPSHIDMDSKVKQMIKLIEEDADSFARRAEMYYKKRPELMKMVEEFYRAYRALAERYENATGVIRQAHRTMVEVFPNHDPFVPGDDSPVSSSPREGDPHTPEMPHPIRAMFDSDELNKDDLGLSSSSFRDAPKNGTAERRTRKGLNFSKADDKELQTVHNSENHNIKSRVLSESERGSKYDREFIIMKEALSKLEAEKEVDLLQYKHSLEKLSSLETEVVRAQENSIRLNERATKAEADALTLKDDLTKLEAEREASNLQYQKCMHTISNLEKNVTLAQENAVELSERASKAEADAQTLRGNINKLEAERELSLHHYEDRLNTISKLEKSITLAHENIAEFSERACKAEADAQTLKEDLNKVKVERDTSLHQYQECLNTISNLEKNISVSQKSVVELTKRASKAETESQTLKEDLTKVKAEREASLHQYQECLNTISTLKKSIAMSQQNVFELSDRASKAETEFQRLNEDLTKVQAEREASLHQYQECLNTISTLEKSITTSQQNVVELSNRASKAETESLTLKEELTVVKTERRASLHQYQECLATISNLEVKNIISQENIVELSERASKAETESQAMKEDLTRVNAEREASLHQYQECLNMISNLEMNITLSQENAVELTGRASKAEAESQAVKHALSMTETEKEAILVQNNLLLAKLSETEQILLQAEENTKRIIAHADKTESDVEKLREALILLTDEKAEAALQYQERLDTISYLEGKLYSAQEESQTLKFEINDGVLKLKDAEERSLHLETLNQSLQSELNSLVQKMGLQNQELSEKQEEIGILRTCIQEERLHFNEIESALQALQYLQSQSKEELTSLSAELEHRAQVLKDLEAHNNGLVDEVHRAKEENKSLKDLNLSSELLTKTIQDEHAILQEVKQKLQNEVELGMGQRNSLQQENYSLKEEINELDKKHRAVVQQVESVGLNPECFGRTVKEIQDENSKLNEVYQKERNEKVALFEKLAIMGKLFEKNAVLESSISELSAELEAMKNKVTELEETCHLHVEDKSVLVSEKNIIFSQLQNTTENNTFLENKLSKANSELEGLREKVNSLEDSCELHGTEISVLMTEREGLASKLQIARQTLEDLVKRHTELEKKCRALDIEKVSTLIKVEELQASLDAVRQEHGKHTQLSATRMADLESQLCFSQEESRQRKKELEKEEEETFNAQTEVFILHKCLKDVEGEIISLLIQSQKLFKASELSKKLVSELEHENLEQKGKVTSLTCQINNTKTWMCRVLKALDIDSDYVCEDEIVQDVAYMDRILIEIEDRNDSNSKSLDEHQQLFLDNMILCTLLGQLRLDAYNLHTEKNKCIYELRMRSKEVMELQSKRQNLEEENCVIYSEAVSFSYLSVIFQNTIIEKSLELNELCENLDKSHEANIFMEETAKTLECKLKMAGMENDQLKESLEKSQNELKTVTFVCSQLNNQVSSGSELLHINESELVEAEKKLQALQIEKMELQNLMEGLTRNFDEVNLIREDQEKHIYKLSEEIDTQSKEWQRLGDMTFRLEARLLTLQERHKEAKVREETLTTQLAKWKNEAELWETEGTAFFTDLQISLIQGVFFLQKIAELTEAYNHQVNSDVMEIECLKQSIGTLEEKNGGLEFQLVSWKSGISSLECSIDSLDKFMLRHLEANIEDKEEEVKDDKLESHLQSVNGDKQNGNAYAKVMPDNLHSLQVLETRIRAIEITMIEREKHAVGEHLNSRWGIEHDPNLLKPPQEIFEAEGDSLPKDIMLDQISESSSYGLSKREIEDAESHLLKLWETTDHNGSIIQEDKRRHPSSEILDKLDISKRFVDPLQEGKKKNILERLDSDLQKLENLQITVQDLIRKIETTEKIKKRKGLEYETVKDQLQESEEAILKLFDVNKKLTDTVKEDALSSEEKSVADSEQSGTIRNIVTEQARRGSEKIGRLQLEVQKLQFLLLKFDDEKESKGKTQIPERRTRVILHNYFRGGILRSSSKQKKGSFCACLRPSIKDD